MLYCVLEGSAERIQQECLNHFVVLGRRHLDYLVREFVAYYHDERPHEGCGNLPPRWRESGRTEGAVACRKRLGGLLRSYERAA